MGEQVVLCRSIELDVSSLPQQSRDVFQVAPAHQALVRAVGLDAEAVFSDERIKVWRTLPDRENATLDALSVDEKPVRIHVKRYAAARGSATPADVEFAGHRLLHDAGIPTAELIAWGRLSDGRSFTLWLDLSGYTPGDKLVEAGTDFEALLLPTADLAAKLHRANLHHRDLYLCHFLVKIVDATVHVKLIDTARVARLTSVFTRRRWIVKDLAQFWYSTTQLPTTDDQRRRWLDRYATQRGLTKTDSLRRSIERKVRAIARHDVKLKLKQPTRNVSIPTV